MKFDRGEFTARIIPAEEPRADELWVEVTPAGNLPRGRYKLSIATPGGTSDEQPIELDDLPQVVEVEPNASAAGAGMTELPSSVWGTLSTMGDVDQVTFEARAGQTIVFDLAAKSLGSKLNGVLTILDPAGKDPGRQQRFQ